MVRPVVPAVPGDPIQDAVGYALATGCELPRDRPIYTYTDGLYGITEARRKPREEPMHGIRVGDGVWRMVNPVVEHDPEVGLILEAAGSYGFLLVIEEHIAGCTSCVRMPN